jgi:ABC-type lipoprotein export system ATPase subunit
LSGGQQQRVAVARALVNGPAIIFADEPTGNLDSTAAQGVMNMLASLNRENGQTFIIVTHSPEVSAHAGRVISMHDGVIVSDVPQTVVERYVYSGPSA